MKPELIVLPSPQLLIEHAFSKVVEAARESIKARGQFGISLSGGSTPKALYEALASGSAQKEIAWEKTHIFFGDERAVESSDELSNYHMACKALLNHVPIPAENIHRMKGECHDLEAAASEYQVALEEFGPLDLVLLGMGEDGHTASLFPHSPILRETRKLCRATPVSSLQPFVRRLTLTFPTINMARRVWLLVTGDAKAMPLERVKRQIESGSRDFENMPILGVQPENEYLWLLDAAAASELMKPENR
jgi:6-phosphogluconolactonase